MPRRKGSLDSGEPPTIREPASAGRIPDWTSSEAKRRGSRVRKEEIARLAHAGREQPCAARLLNLDVDQVAVAAAGDNRVGKQGRVVVDVAEHATNCFRRVLYPIDEGVSADGRHHGIGNRPMAHPEWESDPREAVFWIGKLARQSRDLGEHHLGVMVSVPHEDATGCRHHHWPVDLPTLSG